MIDEIKMRLKKSAALSKRKNDKPFASDCTYYECTHMWMTPLTGTIEQGYGNIIQMSMFSRGPVDDGKKGDMTLDYAAQAFTRG
jgi:hypothetical protein